MASLILHGCLHLLWFWGAPLAILLFVCLEGLRAVRRQRFTVRHLGRNIILSVAVASLICLLFAGLGAWLFWGAQDPDGGPPSG
jgi:hypothetical protein